MSKDHKPIIIGTRKSQMAMQMAERVRDDLLEQFPDLNIKVEGLTSDGDRFQGDLKKIGGKGAFVRNLDQKLLDGEIDCAVHSLKDIPGDEPEQEGLRLLALLEREDPRDALIMRPGLPAAPEPGMVLATSSPRRQAFLKKLYPECKIIPLRGNVNTRLAKLHDKQFDGMVLAYSGLLRLGLEGHVTKIFEPSEMLPAVGQGVVALKVREADVRICEWLRVLNSYQAETVVKAEREMLWVLQGDCHSAIAGHCTIDERMLRMTGIVARPDGADMLSVTESQPLDQKPEVLGRKIAEALLSKGAADYLGMAAEIQVKA